jgi:hypothetical protein
MPEPMNVLLSARRYRYRPWRTYGVYLMAFFGVDLEFQLRDMENESNTVN